jgi:putative MATE family efflux protein
MDHANGDLTRAPIPALIRRLAAPAAMGMMAHTLFSIIDTYYAGTISTEALAGLSASFPVIFIIISFAAGISTGVTALVSNAVGRGDREEARRLTAQSVSFGCVASIGVTLLGWLCGPWLFAVLGAEGAYLDAALLYTNWLFAGTLLFVVASSLNGALVAIGDTRTTRDAAFGGVLANLVLDPWFVRGGFGLPEMGVKGIAIATLVVETGSLLFIGWRAWRSGMLNSRSFRRMWPRRRLIIDLSRQGFPGTANMMSIAVGIFILTWFAGRFGPEAVAGFGIAVRLEQLTLLPIIGFNVSSLALAGQNFGAGRLDRVREMLQHTWRYCLIIAVIGGAIVYPSARWLAERFSHDPAVVEAAVGYLRITVFILWAYGLMFSTIAALQGMKHPMFAVWISIFRQILGPLLAIPLCIKWWGLDGIWWGIFVVKWAAAAITLAYTSRFLVQQERSKIS